MKDHVMEAKKEANPEILAHEFKRDIEVKKIQLREELEIRKYLASIFYSSKYI